uniref:Uncharacterized protein n=1 Tax=Anguilla anguilla TaxID=7936 RepID=A0A0E9VGI6_ANGAN
MGQTLKPPDPPAVPLP